MEGFGLLFMPLWKHVKLCETKGENPLLLQNTLMKRLSFVRGLSWHRKSTDSDLGGSDLSGTAGACYLKCAPESKVERLQRLAFPSDQLLL